MLPEKMNVFVVQVDTKIYIKNESKSLLLLIDFQMKAIFMIFMKQVVAMYTKTLLYSNVGWLHHCILLSCHILDNGCRRKQC